MNKVRRHMIWGFTGVVFALAVSGSPNSEAANINSLFKSLLSKIVAAIIKYFAPEWYENTKTKIEEWSANNTNNYTVTSNEKRAGYASLGDGINSVNSEGHKLKLRLAAAPTPYVCDSESAATAASKALSIVNNESSIIRDIGNPFDVTEPFTPPEKLTSLNEYVNKSTLTLFFVRRGLNSEEIDIVLDIVKRIVFDGEAVHRTFDKSSKKSQFKTVEGLANKRQLFHIRESLDILISSRMPSEANSSGFKFDEIIKKYHPRGEFNGISLWDIISSTVSAYAGDSELIEKINGDNGYSSPEPLLIILSEMEGIENIILSQILKVKKQISLLRSMSAISQEADHEKEA